MIRITTAVLASLLATSAFAADSVATVTGQEGTVLVNQGEEFITVSEAQSLKAGDRLMVMEGGTAQITFADGCVLPVAAGSLVEVPAASTCAGGTAPVQSIGPSYAQAVGEQPEDPSTATVTFWVGAALIAIAATAGGSSSSP